MDLEDQDSDSASDEDFNPEKPIVEADQSDDSSSDDDASASRKRKQRDEPDWDNSGDETTIRKGKRGKQRHKNGSIELVEDDNGAAGFTKTRAMRKAEAQEKKYAKPQESSLDVDSLWAQMSASNKQKETATSPPTNGTKDTTASVTSMKDDSVATSNPAPEPKQNFVAMASGPDPVKIKRVYEFAGEIMTEERTVAADSAEARLYIEQQAKQAEAPQNPPIRRPKKRSLLPTSGAETAQGSKLNTLEKSKLDWAGFVDQEGIAEELEGHDKAKDEYLGRMDFLGRLGAKKDDELRNMKKK